MSLSVDEINNIQEKVSKASSEVKQLLLDCGKLLIANDDFESFKKEGTGNFVTSIDLEAEKMLIARLSEIFPNVNILSEETESNIENIEDEKFLVVIDPIDGTNNFKFNRSHSAISIGIVSEGVSVAGFCYDPYLDKLYHAVIGKGAFCNDDRIKVIETLDLEQWSVQSDNSYLSNKTISIMKTLQNLDPLPWILIKGCAVLGICAVAEGQVDAYFHKDLKPWDVAGAQVIVREAGGRAITHSGMEAKVTDKDLIAGSILATEKLLASLGY